MKDFSTWKIIKWNGPHYMITVHLYVHIYRKNKYQIILGKIKIGGERW